MSSYVEPLEEGRCKRWKLVVSIGSGKNRRRKTTVFEGGKREAQAALKDFEQETTFEDKTNSFYSFATNWNDTRLSSSQIAETTHEKYHYHIKAISPYLTKPLSDTRPSDIQAAYAALSASWSGTTLLSLHNSLLRIFRAAMSEGIIKSNPMLEIDAPKSDTKEKRALSPAEVADVLKQLDVSDVHQFAISLILRCGLRRKEVVGVEWGDVGSTLTVRRAITKSDAGARDIPLDTDTQKLIKKRRKIVERALAKMGATLHQTDTLCCGLDGRPISTNALRLWWERNREAFGLEGWTLHELRHTFLTNLAQAGVHPSVMQRLAGHSSMRTTLSIYTHIHNEDMVKAITSLQNIRQSAPKSAPKSKP